MCFLSSKLSFSLSVVRYSRCKEQASWSFPKNCCDRARAVLTPRCRSCPHKRTRSSKAEQTKRTRRDTAVIFSRYRQKMATQRCLPDHPFPHAAAGESPGSLSQSAHSDSTGWGRSEASVVLKSPHVFLKSGLTEKPLDYSLDGGGGVKREKNASSKENQFRHRRRRGEWR